MRWNDLELAGLTFLTIMAYVQSAVLGNDSRLGVSRMTNWTRFSIGIVCAIPVLIAILMIDKRIVALTGYGVNDLQHVPNLAAARTIFAAWQGSNTTAHTLIGVSLGIDYLFMFFYGVAFFFGGLATRDALASHPGLLLNLLTAVSCVILVGAVMDGVENPFQYRALVGTGLTEAAYHITATKWPIVYLGMVFPLIGIVVAVAKRLSRG